MPADEGILMHTVDGEYLLEIVSNDVSRSDYATILQFQEWAPDLLNACKIDDVKVTGGVAGDLGK